MNELHLFINSINVQKMEILTQLSFILHLALGSFGNFWGEILLCTVVHFVNEGLLEKKNFFFKKKKQITFILYPHFSSAAVVHLRAV